MITQFFLTLSKGAYYDCDIIPPYSQYIAYDPSDSATTIDERESEEDAMREAERVHGITYVRNVWPEGIVVYFDTLGNMTKFQLEYL